MNSRRVNRLLANTSQEPSLVETIRILRRHQWIALGSFTCILAITTSAVILWPRTYASEARLYVKISREASTLDPTVVTGHPIAVQRSPQRDITAVREIMQSQSVLERVVESIGVDAILEKKPGAPSLFKRLRSSLSLNNLDPISDYERAVRRLRERIKVTVTDEVDIVSVTNRAGSPELAKEILEAFLDAFFEVHREVKRVSGGYQFFVHQAEEAKQRLEDARNRLREQKQDFGIVTIEGKRALLTEKMKTIDQELSRIARELVNTESKSSHLRETLNSLPKTVVQATVDGVGNQGTDQMRAQLYSLQIEEEQLRAQLRSPHPKLQAVQEQRRQVEEILSQQPVTRSQQTEAINPAVLQLTADLLGAQAIIAGLRSESEKLQQQRTELQLEVTALNDREILFASIESEVDLLSESYQTVCQRREEAKLNDELDSEKISSINVLQKPTLWESPVVPRVKPSLLVGAFVAICLSAAIVVIREYLDTSFTVAEQVERQLQIPVLTSIPRIKQQDFEVLYIPSLHPKEN